MYMTKFSIMIKKGEAKMKSTKKFKAESKKLLELMIHSIYSNKEVFLRELVSNASDALDKRHFLSLQNQDFQYEELKIEIETDKESRTVTIKDTGVGMSREELENNLGTIAHSGSKEFLEKLQQQNSDNDASIIGQFGVGFYSSFIVADKVVVKTKTVNNEGYVWTSTGEESYTIDSIAQDFIGTEIMLHIREGEEYDTFLANDTLQAIVKKYSDYIKYPIYMQVTREEPELDEAGNPIEGKYHAIITTEVVNSQVAIWKKNKKDVTEDEYHNFYMSQFHDYQKPLHILHTKAEGTINYNALLFIPASRSYDFYQTTYKKGLELYTKGVLIEERCEGLISDTFRFVRGLVDTEDLSLNISREMLQQDRQLEKISKSLDTKIKNELSKMQQKNRETYNTFYEQFGMQLMYSIYDNFGAKKELLQDLIMFKTSKSDNYVTLKEYVERMQDDQKAIYFAVGANAEQIKQLPQMEQVLEHNIEVLYFFNDVDEFAIKMLNAYDGKEFKSITQGDFDFATEDTKKELEEKATESKTLLEKMKEILKNEVTDVRLTSRLKNSPVCVVGGEGVSLEMEKVLNAMPEAAMGMKAQRILEINPKHPLFEALESVVKKDETKLPVYAKVLYNQALILEGLPIDNPVDYAQNLTQLMIDAAQK